MSLKEESAKLEARIQKLDRKARILQADIIRQKDMWVKSAVGFLYLVAELNVVVVRRSSFISRVKSART